jgi:hypothetical protein
LVELRGKVLRITSLVILVLILSASIGSTVFVLADMHYTGSETQGPYDYVVKFGEGIEAEDLGVAVNINLSFTKTWFVSEEKNVALEVSAEKVSSLVQNFSWRIFWIKLFTVKDGKWKDIVAHGSSFLNESEWSDSHLYKHQNIPVHITNLNYLESVGKAWFGIEIMMSVFHNNTEYNFTFSTPRSEIGPVAVLSPLYSPISLAAISTSITAISTALASHLIGKIALISKKKPLAWFYRFLPHCKTITSPIRLWIRN